jgi:hypothetical protein
MLTEEEKEGEGRRHRRQPPPLPPSDLRRKRALSGEGEPESSASSWVVAREFCGGKWEGTVGRRGRAAFYSGEARPK